MLKWAIFGQFWGAKCKKMPFSNLNNFFNNAATDLKISGVKMYQKYSEKMLI